MPVPGAYEKHCPVIVFISFFLEIYQEMRDFFSVVIHALSLIVGW